MLDATFATPDVTTFCRLDELGLVVVGQKLEPDRAVLACRVEEDDAARWCRRCGCEGAARDTVTRELAHEPLGWRPTTLLVTVRRSTSRLARWMIAPAARAALMAMLSMGCKEACDMGMRLRNSVRRVANERGEGLAEGKSGARVLRGHAGLQRLR